MRLEAVRSFSCGQKLGQVRAAPLNLGGERALMTAYGADFEIDPYHEMFFYPTDTLKVAAWTTEGALLWKRELGRGVVPGMWFCPFLPFDLDGDGHDEIYFVNNLDDVHPFGLSSYRLERLNGQTGETTGQWPWPHQGHQQALSRVFRNFLLGGFIAGENGARTPVLVAANGTYGPLLLKGFISENGELKEIWETRIALDTPGARGSHMTPVADIDGDGDDELMWGERCLSLRDGREKWCADRDSYRGHSDVVQPFWDERDACWRIYTCREGERQVSPRVATFDAQGARVWGAVEAGHMDIGWAARLGEEREHIATAIRIESKTVDREGRERAGLTEFAFDARTGAPRELPFARYRALPVDLNGDGWHELVYGVAGGDGRVIDRHGRKLGRIEGTVALIGKFCDRPGEQLLCFRPDGQLQIWADREAHDSPFALRRYAHPFYGLNARFGFDSSSINGLTLAGI